MKPLIVSLVSAVLLLSFSGCASYIPPGAKADLQAFAPPSIQEGFAAKPTAPFPAGIAAVRVQAPSYSNHYLQRNGGRYGDGRYTVILTHEVEEQSHFDRVTSLPQVSGVIGINRMLLPARLDGDREIREAASRLQADLVFLYTFDTAFCYYAWTVADEEDYLRHHGFRFATRCPNWVPLLCVRGDRARSDARDLLGHQGFG